MQTQTYSFRIPADLREKLEERAQKEGRTLANLIIWILREASNR